MQHHTKAFRRNAILTMLMSMEFEFGSVPFGDPSRWQIRSAALAIKRESTERDLGIEDSNPDLQEEESLLDDFDLSFEIDSNLETSQRRVKARQKIRQNAFEKRAMLRGSIDDSTSDECPKRQPRKINQDFNWDAAAKASASVAQRGG